MNLMRKGDWAFSTQMMALMLTINCELVIEGVAGWKVWNVEEDAVMVKGYEGALSI